MRLIKQSYAIFLILNRNYSKNLKLSHLNKFQIESAVREMAVPKSRPNPILMKLDTPDFKSLFSDELKTLISLFNDYGYEIRMAGGAVRDLLMGIKPKDVDFATVATPDQMKEMFTKENVRMINAKGEKHGTITPRINDKENFEVTTLRIDVVTDGRHAEVQYTTDWLLDAYRRDLTINSMFLGTDGTVFDHFYGYEDLMNKKVVFVGDATTRIREDYLRILRYFRFYGRIAIEPDNHDQLTLKSIKENAAGLASISGERIWMELKKILEGNYAGEILSCIVNCGLCTYIGLPPEPNVDEMQRIWKRSGSLKLHAITILTTLLEDAEDVAKLHARLKLSAFERDLAFFLVEHRKKISGEDVIKQYKRILLKSKSKESDTRQWLIELAKYERLPDDQLQEFESWVVPKFPVTGKMLKDAGVESGKPIGLVMTELKNYWADRDFEVSVDELLQQVPEVVEMLSKKRSKRKT